MRDSFTNDHSPEPSLDNNDPVWRLLAQAPRPEPDAWFTVRTLARCRYEGLTEESSRVSFRRIWRWALGGGLAVCLALGLFNAQIHSNSSTPQKEYDVQEAFAVMASLDTDSDSSSSTSNSTWQDSSL